MTIQLKPLHKKINLMVETKVISIRPPLYFLRYLIRVQPVVIMNICTTFQGNPMIAEISVWLKVAD